MLSLPPFRFGGFFAWIALVPLLTAVYYETQLKRMDRLVTITSLGALPLFIWLAWWLPDLIRIAWPNPPTVLQQALFISGFVVAVFAAKDLYGGLIRDLWKRRSLPQKGLLFLPSVFGIFVLPLIWTSFEFLALNIPGAMRIGAVCGFWSIAKTQWTNPAILQLASFTGMYGLTFLILMVNCAITYAIVHYRESKSVSKQAIVVLLIFAVIFASGLISVPEREKGAVNVAIIQIPLEGEDLSNTFLKLSEKSLKYDPKIIVWPLSGYGEIGVEPYANFGREHNVYLTDGNVILYPDGRVEHHNFGYHVITVARDITTGDIYHLFFPEIQGFDTDFGKVGVTVCIESGSTLPARDLAKQSVLLLVVPTGSPNAYVFSWALGTNAIYRAVEHRMFAVEVVGDYDGSMVVDPYGRIVEDIAPEPEIVVGKISFADERTFYRKYGDVFGWSIVSFTIVLSVYNFYLGRRSTFKYCINEKCRAKIKKDAEVCDKCGASQKKPPLWRRIILHESYEWREKTIRHKVLTTRSGDVSRKISSSSLY